MDWVGAREGGGEQDWGGILAVQAGVTPPRGISFPREHKTLSKEGTFWRGLRVRRRGGVLDRKSCVMEREERQI